MKIYILLSLLLSGTLPAISQSHTIDVETHGFRANWYESKIKNAPTIILFGGSEGGTGFGDRWAPKLNEKGYSILSMAYLGEENLPGQLELIPLEYLDKAIEWLDENSGNLKESFGLIGVSKGAELALLQASRINRFSAIVALAPSSVVWQSINRQDFMSNKSSWTLMGKPVSFLPYCYAKGYDQIFNFYDCALDSLDQNAKIRVEKIQSPILLVSGGDDKLWPSERMANMIMKRLTAVDYEYPFYHKNIPAAGHWLVAPEKETLTEQDSIAFKFLGGSPDKLYEISDQVEREVYEFLRRHMKR